MFEAISLRIAFVGALLVLTLSAATGLAFAGWMTHAPGIFTALIDSGLAWCM